MSKWDRDCWVCGRMMPDCICGDDENDLPVSDSAAIEAGGDMTAGGVMDLRETVDNFGAIGRDHVRDLNVLLEAARLLLAGREVWWCQGTRIEDGQFKGILPGSADWQNCFEGRIPRHRDCGPVRVVPVKEQK